MDTGRLGTTNKMACPTKKKIKELLEKLPEKVSERERPFLHYLIKIGKEFSIEDIKGRFNYKDRVKKRKLTKFEKKGLVKSRWVDGKKLYAIIERPNI